MTNDFAMFTEEGNNLVADLVEMCKNNNLRDTTVMALMSAIAKDERFAEITDTAVRETIGCELGFYN